MGLKVLALCIGLWKGFIAYHKSNGITSMKKHVKIEYNVILKKFLDNVTNAIVAPLACEPAKKRTHVTPLAIFEFFSYVNQFKKNNETQIGSLEDLMFFDALPSPRLNPLEGPTMLSCGKLGLEGHSRLPALKGGRGAC